MKKYLFATLTFISVSIWTVFNNPKSSQLVDVEFVYVGSTYTEADVTDVNNWIEASGGPTCNGVNHRACKIRVAVTFTIGSAPNRSISPTAVVNLAYYPPCNSWYVISGGDIISFINKSC